MYYNDEPDDCLRTFGNDLNVGQYTRQKMAEAGLDYEDQLATAQTLLEESMKCFVGCPNTLETRDQIRQTVACIVEHIRQCG